MTTSHSLELILLQMDGETVLYSVVALEIRDARSVGLFRL